MSKDLSFNICLPYDSHNGEWGLKFCNGYKYQGELNNGRMEGKGRLEWENGTVYEGELKHNQIEGYGTMIWPDGSVYRYVHFFGSLNQC